MRRYLLLLTAAVGLPLAMVGATEARPMMGMGAGIGVGSSFNARASNMAIIHSRTTLRSRAEVRELQAAGLEPRQKNRLALSRGHSLVQAARFALTPAMACERSEFPDNGLRRES